MKTRWVLALEADSGDVPRVRLLLKRLADRHGFHGCRIKCIGIGSTEEQVMRPRRRCRRAHVT